MRNSLFTIVLLAFLCAPSSTQSQEAMIGEIKMFAGNFAPRGWAFCEGQLLPISQNTALFSILGTTYGGDGRTTFGLPDLRGRAPIHPGTGPGLSTFRLGQKGGAETLALMVVGVSDRSKDKVGVVGQSVSSTVPINKRDPYIAINYIIALYGTYPSRN